MKKVIVKDDFVMKHLFVPSVCDLVYAHAVTCGKENMLFLCIVSKKYGSSRECT